MGVFYGLVSAATFGLIPLFTLPLLAAGISIETSLAYRFVLAALMVGLILLARGERFAIGWQAFFKIFGLALFYMAAVILFFHAFHYLPSGIVATLQFQYPVMVLLIMAIFFHERLNWQTCAAVALAVAGVALLSMEPNPGERQEANAMVGVMLALLAGLCNGLYFVGIRVAKLPKINGLLLTFYIMLCGSGVCLANGAITSSLQWLSASQDVFAAVMLALVTAVISNLTLVLAIRMIGPTLTSILGVAEPLTAVAIGVAVFGEPMTMPIGCGIALIILAVLLVLKKRGPATQEN